MPHLKINNLRDQREFISYEALNIMSVCIAALVIRHANRVFLRHSILSSVACLALRLALQINVSYIWTEQDNSYIYRITSFLRRNNSAFLMYHRVTIGPFSPDIPSFSTQKFKSSREFTFVECPEFWTTCYSLKALYILTLQKLKIYPLLSKCVIISFSESKITKQAMYA
jgi:hypothetical protein